MANKLKDEIRQNKPFQGLEHEALLNIQRTSSEILHAFQQIMKEYGLTESQYNVLRILRGADAAGLRCSEISDRMVSRDPDITRLLERLHSRGMIERTRDGNDRRVVYAHITATGLRILDHLQPLIERSAIAMMGHMSKEKMGQLIDLLEEVRQGMAA